MADEKETEADLSKTQEMPRDHMAVPPPHMVQAATESDRFRAVQARIKEMIAADVPLPEILTELVLMIEAQAPDMLCSILLISDDGNHVKHAVAPSLPDSYVKAVDGSPNGPKRGSCGTAMYRGEPVIVSDIATDPLWDDYRDLASAIGVAACWSTPILSSKRKVYGSFAMYYREPRTPDGDERYLTDAATKLAAEAIEHDRKRKRR